MNRIPVEIPADVAAVAAKVAEVLSTLPENQGDSYVERVTFGFHGDPYTNFYVGTNEFGGYSLFMVDEEQQQK